jgi:GGDEF domain-containing protein
MTFAPEPPRPSRSQPLSGLPIDALSARADELSRRWAIALILERPLPRIGEVALEELARDGGELCEQVLRALESQAALDLLLMPAETQPRGRGDLAARLAAIAGAGDAPAAVAAVEALRAVLWDALAQELGEPSARQAHSPRAIGDAADRLAHVCALLAAAAAGRAGQAPGGERSSSRVGAEPGGPVAGRVSAPPARIVDEREEPEHGREPGPDALRVQADARPERPAYEERAVEIEVHDRRAGERPGAWIAAIERGLERFRATGVPFAVVLVQVTGWEPWGRDRDLEELLAAVPERPAADLLVDAQLREPRGGSFTREHAGRYWLVVPGVDRVGAQLLAERLSREASTAVTARGHALEIAIGTASCPSDGRDATALAAHADVGLYAARAAARAAAARSVATVPSESAD